MSTVARQILQETLPALHAADGRGCVPAPPETPSSRSPTPSWPTPVPTVTGTMLRTWLDSAHHRVQSIRCAAVIPATCSATSAAPGGGIMALRGPCHDPGLDRHRHPLQPTPRLPECSQCSSAPRYASGTTSMPRRTRLPGGRTSRSISSASSRPGMATPPRPRMISASHFLPQDHRRYSRHPNVRRRCHDGIIKGLMAVGQNPAGQRPALHLHRQALGKLDWLIVRDLFETETATSGRTRPGDQRRGQAPGHQTEVILLPAAAVAETDGSFTNTQRLLQWHEKAADPTDDFSLRRLVHLSPGPALERCMPTARRIATGRSRR